MLRSVLSLIVGKFIIFLTHALRLGGGSAAPGLYALKTDPLLIQRLVSQIPTNIIITGTNGKTTTARLIHYLLNKQGIKTIRNSTGSNLERGIASALLTKASFWGEIKNIEVGIWEVDEAAFNTLAIKLKPDVLVFLNAFRDQLDRYGEVDSVIRKWQVTLDLISQQIEASKKPINLIVNGDDGNTSKLKIPSNFSVEYFGLAANKITGEKSDIKSSHSLALEARNVELNGIFGSTFDVKTIEELYKIKLPLAGKYQIYNFLAAFGVYRALNMPMDNNVFDLINFKNAFGRVEEITYKGKTGYILLIKNPIGATNVIETITQELTQKDTLLLVLNDNFADGKDISWIWDTDFERFKANDKRFRLRVSGSRALDMANRMKYAGFLENRIDITENLQQAFEEVFENPEGKVYILPTYTALLDLQKILSYKKIKKNYWREDI